MRIGRLVIVILGALTLAGFVNDLYEVGYRLFYGKSSFAVEAVFPINGTSSELILSRRAIHFFLAEYERTLILRDDGREIFRFTVAGDSGGFSRLNIYQTDRFKFYLAGDHSSDRYIVNTLCPAISRESLREKPTGAQFLGAFDRDELGWRFIPASEREEKTTAVSGVKRIPDGVNTVDAHVKYRNSQSYNCDMLTEGEQN